MKLIGKVKGRVAVVGEMSDGTHVARSSEGQTVLVIDQCMRAYSDEQVRELIALLSKSLAN